VCVCGVSWEIPAQHVHEFHAALTKAPTLAPVSVRKQMYVHSCHFDPADISFGKGGQRCQPPWIVEKYDKIVPEWDVQVDMQALGRRHGYASPQVQIFSKPTLATLCNLCPAIEIEEVADMTRPQMLEFCNMKLDAVREEAVSANMTAEFAKSQFLSCESLLLDFNARLQKMEEDLKRAESRGTHSDQLLILKTQEVDRLLQRRESLTSTYVDTCRRRYSGMTMRRLQNCSHFPEARVRVLTNVHSFQELSFFYHSVINHDGAMDRLAFWASEEGEEKEKKRKVPFQRRTASCFVSCG